MVLFETVRDLRFADNIENTLSSIDNELKKANLLKERELELKDKEIKLKKDNDFLKVDYKKAFEEACARLEDMDKILYEIDQSVEPFSKERYQNIILTNIHKLEKTENSKFPEVLEISKEEFDQFTKTFNRNKTEYKEYCEQVQQNFGSSFMFFDFENRKYICYDFVQGENGLPNIEEIINRELALQWLEGRIEIDEVREIENKMDIELDIEM